ncbi:hypothetical protein LUZ60_016223 [Juncus effusus]|nr:hypothetical protein LUZ60_016223 [Juncus effusus]
MVERWVGLGTALASFMFLWAVVHHFIPFQVQYYLTSLVHKLISFFNPYIDITIEEYSSESSSRSKGYAAAEAYLSGSCSQRARHLKAELAKDTSRFLVTIDNQADVTDEFRGAKIWWSSHERLPFTRTISWHPCQEVRRWYCLTFHRRQRKLVEDVYLPYVLDEGGAILARNRERRLYMNNLKNVRSWSGSKKPAWCHVTFEHPATFDSLAMDPARKKEIVDDLVRFRNGKEYYAKIGRAWMRKYLLSGPRGTGKSSIIAAMANFLGYDVYDLQLTAVKDMAELHKLFIETTRKSIIVVRDIDFSTGLACNYNGKTVQSTDVVMGKQNKRFKNGETLTKENEEDNMVTLLRFLNSLDGIWSGFITKRILVFKTNNENELDLTVRSRMDRNIRMAYCGFESFKILAENYLGIKIHSSFDKIKTLLSEVNITAADVTEKLMCVYSGGNDVDECISKLVEMLESRKNSRGEADGCQDNDF